MRKNLIERLEIRNRNDEISLKTNMPKKQSYSASERYKKSSLTVRSTQTKYSIDSIEKRLNALKCPNVVSVRNKHIVIQRLSTKFELLEKDGYQFEVNEAEKTYETAFSFEIAKKRTNNNLEKEYGDLTVGQYGLAYDEVKDLKDLYAERFRLECLADVIEVSLPYIKSTLHQEISDKIQQLGNRIEKMAQLPFKRLEKYKKKTEPKQKQLYLQKIRSDFGNNFLVICESKKQSIQHQDFRIKIQNTQSISEVVEILNKSGYLNGSAIGWQCLSLGTAQMLANVYSIICEKYPFLIGYVRNITFKNLKVDCYSHFCPEVKDIDLSTRYYRNWKEKYCASCFVTDMELAKTGNKERIESTLIYQAGFALEDYLESLLLQNLEIKIPCTKPKDKLSTIIGRHIQFNFRQPYLNSSSQSMVSESDLKNSSVWFANALCDYNCSSSPRSVSMKVGEILERFMQGDFSELFKYIF